MKLTKSIINKLKYYYNSNELNTKDFVDEWYHPEDEIIDCHFVTSDDSNKVEIFLYPVYIDSNGHYATNTSIEVNITNLIID